MAKSKKETIQLAMIILFYIGYVTYIYLKPDNISSTTLTEIKGLLLEEPFYEEPNGDNVPNINFELIGDSRKFKIESCGLKEIDFETMMGLEPRDSVIFKIKKRENLNIRERINSKIEVFEIRNSSARLLTLENLNNCEKSTWKELLLVTVLMIFGLAITIGERIFNKPLTKDKKT